jgi:hypothetical protein
MGNDPLDVDLITNDPLDVDLITRSLEQQTPGGMTKNVEITVVHRAEDALR